MAVTSAQPNGYTAGTNALTVLAYEDQDSELDTFANTIGFIKSISLPSISRSALETTLLDDTIKTFIAGIKEFGEMSLDCLYDSVSSKAVYDLLIARDSKAWRLTFPDGGTFTFDGYIKSIGTEVPEGGELVSQSITIKLSADIAPIWAVSA